MTYEFVDRSGGEGGGAELRRPQGGSSGRGKAWLRVPTPLDDLQHRVDARNIQPARASGARRPTRNREYNRPSAELTEGVDTRGGAARGGNTITLRTLQTRTLCRRGEPASGRLSARGWELPRGCLPTLVAGRSSLWVKLAPRAFNGMTGGRGEARANNLSGGEPPEVKPSPGAERTASAASQTSIRVEEWVHDAHFEV